MSLNPIRIAVLTVSDACSSGEREDVSGGLLVDWARAAGRTLVERAVVPDDVGPITSRLTEWSDAGHVDVIVSTGGTGFGPRDVTPEATLPVLDRSAPGLAEEIRRKGIESTPYAVLSRGLAGTRAETLIVNLPGSPGGVRDGIAVLDRLVDHIVQLIRGGRPSHKPSPQGDTS